MIVASLALLFQLPEADDPRRMFAAGSTDAYYMEPPEVVSKPFVRRLMWTGDGSSLLVERIVPPARLSPAEMADALQTDGLEGLMRLHPKVQIVAWGTRSRTARVLVDLAVDRTTIDEIEPLSGSDKALVVLTEKPVRADGTPGPVQHAFVLLSASTGNMRRIWSGAEPPRYRLAPKRPLGALYFGVPRESEKVALFGLDGALGELINLPPGARFGFSEDGRPGAVVTKILANGRRTGEFRLIDARTGALGAVVTEQFFGREVPPALRSYVSRERSERDRILLLVDGGRTKEPTPDEVGIVTTDGSLPALSPSNNAIAYVSGHSALVRPLVKISRKDYDEAMQEAEKQKAMRYAKQIGTAMSLYAMDADDAFPPLGGDGKEVVYPYLKNRSALDAFTYTFGGGAVAGNPGEVELGYVSGPGGRAVVYADGTVKWLPDGV